MNKRPIYLFLLLAMAGAAGAAEESNEVLVQEHLSATPTWILTKVTVGSKEGQMLISTGAERSAYGQSWNDSVFQPAKKDDAAATAPARPGTRLLDSQPMTIQSLHVARPRVEILDFSRLAEMTTPGLVGIIGCPELSRDKFFIQNDKSTAELHSGPWKLEKGFQEITTEEDTVTPQFYANIDLARIRFEIDTGSDTCIQLEAPMFDLMVNEGMIKAADGEGKSESLTGQAKARRGWFLKGELMGKQLRGVMVNSINGRFGVLGLKWLWGYNYEVDIGAHRVRYALRDHPAPPLVIEQMTGFVGAYTEAGIRVERVKPGGGPAQDTGLAPGDVIEAFDFLSLKELNAANFDAAVTAKAGAAVDVLFHRKADGQEVKARLQIGPPISAWSFWGESANAAEAAKP